MARTITFTLDLEDPRPDRSYSPRYIDVAHRVLDHLSEKSLRGTVFVVGEVAREAPSLVQKITDLGHEVGFHSSHHVPLTLETPDQFQRQCHDGRRRLEDLCGQAVSGFRAPSFSLTAQTLWAVPILAETGFGYSSSVLPARNPLFGFPQAPRGAFRWPNQLLEIPVPVARLGPFTLPFLGGIYLRYLPMSWVRHLLRKQSQEQVSWVYCHPYDFDDRQPYYRMKGTSLMVSLLLWFNRQHTLDKLTTLMTTESSGSRPFAEDIQAGRFDDVAIFDPRDPQ